MKLSVIIIAKNEERCIRRCLDSVRWADEIVILDSGSTDQTVKIAQEYTSQVYQTDWKGYGVQKQRALSYATQEWVLNLDADEVVDEALRNEIQNTIRHPQADAYKIPIKMIFLDKKMRFSSSPSRHVRLFKRAGARYSDDIVHEKIILPPTARVNQLANCIYHKSFRDVQHALYKMNRYSSYSAKIRLTQGKTSSVLISCFSSFWMFFRCYLLQGGLWDGKEGFLLAVFNAQGSFYRGIKQVYPDSSQGHDLE